MPFSKLYFTNSAGSMTQESFCTTKYGGVFVAHYKKSRNKRKKKHLQKHKKSTPKTLPILGVLPNNPLL